MRIIDYGGTRMPIQITTKTNIFWKMTAIYDSQQKDCEYKTKELETLLTDCHNSCICLKTGIQCSMYTCPGN